MIDLIWTVESNVIIVSSLFLSLREPNQSTPSSPVYEFKMNQLVEHLRRQAESYPNSHYFNVDILKYQVSWWRPILLSKDLIFLMKLCSSQMNVFVPQIKSGPGATSAPFQLVTFWKCEASHTDLRIDYKYNGKTAMASPAPLLNLAISVPVDGGVKSMHARPVGTWSVPSRARISSKQHRRIFYEELCLILFSGWRSKRGRCGNLPSCRVIRSKVAAGRWEPGLN